MNIKHDQFLISAEGRALIERGYGIADLNTLRFEFLYPSGDGQNGTETVRPSSRLRNEIMKSVIDAIAGQLICYQYNAPQNIPYGSPEWDLYFWCLCLEAVNSPFGDGRDYSYFTLTFNQAHSPEKRREICNRVLKLLETQFGALDNLYLFIQYAAAMDEKKISADAESAAPALDGKRCSYHHHEGKLVYTQGSLFYEKVRKEKGVSAATSRCPANQMAA